MEYLYLAVPVATAFLVFSAIASWSAARSGRIPELQRALKRSLHRHFLPKDGNV